jgi:uncharacterized protein YdeI (YjbR/CyaY-like superfamily)
MVDITETLYVPTREEWRAWLEANHTTHPGIWFTFYKKHTGQPSVSYNDAVEEALCFGWIDNIQKKLDEDRYVLKFSPRRKGSVWSRPNKDRVIRLMDAGKMMQAGLDALGNALNEPDPEPRPQANEIPPELAEALAKNPAAQEHFDQFPPSYKRLSMGWILAAKRPETRQKRIQEVVDLAAQNKRIEGK